MLTPTQIKQKLEEYKDCKRIRITVIDGTSFDINYADITNDTKQEVLLIDALFDWDKRMFLYCVIKSIQPL